MAYLRVVDDAFDRTVSLRQAYAILEAFIAQYNARGESSTLALMTDVGITADGTSSDPAQIYDFVRVAGTVLGDESLIGIGSKHRAG